MSQAAPKTGADDNRSIQSGIRQFRHVGITVSDLDAAARFYCRYLGLEVVAERHGQSGTYISTLVGVEDAVLDITLLEGPGGFRLELLQYRSHPRAPAAPAQGYENGRPHFALTVGDLRSLYNRREAFGVTFKSPPLASPDDPVMVAYCHDPDGTIVELVELLDMSHGS